MWKLLILFIVSAFALSQRKLPDFIHLCQLNVANVNECALKNGRYAVPYIVQGYKPFNLPKLAPLDISRLKIQIGNNLNIEFTKSKIYGLENTWITDIDMQMDKQHMIFKVHIPLASIVGHYKMNGQYLIFPIRGEGPANVTIVNGDYVYNMDFALLPRAGNKYLSITNHSITFNTSRAYYHFENLFNGDSGLGEQMNKFLEENWREITKDVGATIAETISSIITSIAQSIFNQVSYDELIAHN